MRRLTLSLLLVTGLAGASFGESVGTPNAVKLTKYILGVSDLEKSVAFYRALGIELASPAMIGKPQALPEFLTKLVDVPAGAKFRNAMMKIPGADFALELTEFTGMEVHPARPRIQDPGASLLFLRVRDVDGALSAAKSAGANVVTPGGLPLRNEKTKTRAVAVIDPDGFYTVLAQPETLPSASGPPVIEARWASVVSDTGLSHIYTAPFGFKMNSGDFGADPFLAVVGAAGTQYRKSVVQTSPNLNLWSFYEWKGIDRKPYRLRIPDPGAPAIGLEVRDLDAAAAAFKVAGGSMVTQGGSIQLPNGDKLAFMRDPSGILVEIAQPAARK
jgi:catechol 2,3-dioxygenase-like lactoylglutathione lyase family enzyme